MAIFKEKGKLKNCNAYRGVKLLEPAKKVVNRLLKRIREFVNTDAKQFGFMPGRGTAVALFVASKMQEGYRYKEKKLFVL